jgi:hypothetical protein
MDPFRLIFFKQAPFVIHLDRKRTVYSVKFFIRSNRPLWQPAGTANHRISNFEGWKRFAKSFLKQTEYIHSTFDVGRSMFDVHQFLFDLAGGWADT